MIDMSINSISVLHTSWMIAREVDLVEANPYKILFYLLFDHSAAARLSSFGKMKETSKIRLPPPPPTSFFSIFLHLNQRSSSAHLPDFFSSHIISAPPAPSTSILV